MAKLKIHSSKLKDVVTEEDRKFIEEVADEFTTEEIENASGKNLVSKDNRGGFEIYGMLETEANRLAKLISFCSFKIENVTNKKMLTNLTKEQEGVFSDLETRLIKGHSKDDSTFNRKMGYIWDRGFSGKD